MNYIQYMQKGNSVQASDNTRVEVKEKQRPVAIQDMGYLSFIDKHGFIPYDEYQNLISADIPTIKSISKEQIERNKRQTQRAEKLEEMRPAMEQAVSTMSVGSNIRTDHMSNEALLGLGQQLSNQWNTTLAAADPIGSAVGLATGHLAGKGAVALNHAVGSPIEDQAAAIAGAVLGGYAGMRYGAPVVKNIPAVYDAYKPLPESVVVPQATGIKDRITNFLFRPVDRAVQTGQWSSFMTKLNEKFVQLALKYPNLSRHLVEAVTSRPKVSKEALASYAETVGVPESRAAVNQAIQEGRYYPYMTRQQLRNYFTEGQKVIDGAVSQELIQANAGAAATAQQFETIKSKAKVLSDDLLQSVPEADAYVNTIVSIKAGASSDDALRANGLTPEQFSLLRDKYGDVIFPTNNEDRLFYFSHSGVIDPNTELPTTSFVSKRLPEKTQGGYSSVDNHIVVSARPGIEADDVKVLRPLYTKGHSLQNLPDVSPAEYIAAHEGQHFLQTQLPQWKSSVIYDAVGNYHRTNPISKFAADFPYWTGLKTKWQFAPTELDANLKAIEALYPNASIYEKAAALTKIHPELFNGDIDAMVKQISAMQALGYKNGGKLNYLNLFNND